METGQHPKYGALDRPLKIGDIEIPCYVLADGTRVLAQRGLQGGIGLSLGGGKTGARRIAELMTSLAEKDIDVRGLIVRANSPIRFIPPHGGNPADGYEATILPDICAVLIEANQQVSLASIASIWQRAPPNFSTALRQSGSSHLLMKPRSIRIFNLKLREHLCNSAIVKLWPQAI